jgi:hypothetical protein
VRTLTGLNSLRWKHGILMDFTIGRYTQSQSSNVRSACCWRKVISIRRQTQRAQTVGRHFLACERPTLWSDPVMACVASNSTDLTRIAAFSELVLPAQLWTAFQRKGLVEPG